MVKLTPIARDIILLTLIVDHEGGKDCELWDIYYHLRLSDTAFELLKQQVESLLALSNSLETWHRGKYGKWLRICDSGTLVRIRDIWASYIVPEADEISLNNRFEAWIQKARDRGMHLVQGKCNLDEARSAGPVPLQKLPDVFQNFWENGTTDGMSGLANPNPTFFNDSGHAITLHYGTNPLLRFHLALAHAALSPKSPLQTPISPLCPVLAAARHEFNQWVTSFRGSIHEGLTLRFFNGDALSFCHALQHKASGQGQCNWYRDQYTSQPLILDSKDYDGDAPLLFNVIDTSNLVDHLGGINVLTAASPLLDGSGSAVLYLDTLVKKEEHPMLLLDSLLCGNAPTICMLLRLTPVEYWTNSTVTSSVEEHFLDIAATDIGGKEAGGQMRTRLVLKRFIKEETQLNPSSLAHLLHQVYLEMFKHEDMQRLFSKVNLQMLQNSSILYYHRGSFVALLSCMKGIIRTDWKQTLDILLGLIEGETRLLVNGQYMQELYMQLHLQNLYSVLPLRSLPPHTKLRTGLGAWDQVPPVVCVTLLVPWAFLKVFNQVSRDKLGTPILHGIIQCSPAYRGRPWQHIFAMIQLTFGELKIEGSNQDKRLSIEEDKCQWSGTSPLIASFLAPSWILSIEPCDAVVALGVQSTPQSSTTFMKHLGTDLNLFETTLADEQHVLLTKHQPNLSGHTLFTGEIVSGSHKTRTLIYNLDCFTSPHRYCYPKT